MDPSETNNFEDQWKKAFNEASETPPSSVWAGIEARLDRDEDHVIPLWWRSPKLWFAAASVAALLLVGSGLWYAGSSEMGVEMAVKTPSSQADMKKDQAKKPMDTLQEKIESPAVTSNSQVGKNSIVKSRGSGSLAKTQIRKYSEDQTDKDPESQQDPIVHTEKQLAVTIRNKNQLPALPNEKAEKQEVSSAIMADQTLKSAEQGFDEDNRIASTPGKISGIDLLTPNPYRDLEVFMQKRYVFFKGEQKEELVAEIPKKQKEYYAGIGLMPATFNPDLQIKSAPESFSTMQNSRQKALTGTSKAGNSIAIQTQGGMRLSKHWSLEMGLGYLQGNSKYEGGGYVLDAFSSKTTNVLEDALLSLSTGKNAVPNSPAPGGAGQTNFGNNALYIDVNKNVSNNYQFLQLPVQAGFTINPDRKLSYSVLGGMMANFFLSNQLESASGEIIKTIASDEIYKSTNWAATTGLRFNYKLSSKWKASLTGSYQKSVSSGFRANQSLESHPYLYGISWGMRYSF